jgi:hypothetical protein
MYYPRKFVLESEQESDGHRAYISRRVAMHTKLVQWSFGPLSTDLSCNGRDRQGVCYTRDKRYAGAQARHACRVLDRLRTLFAQGAHGRIRLGPLPLAPTSQSARQPRVQPAEKMQYRIEGTNEGSRNCQVAKLSLLAIGPAVHRSHARHPSHEKSNTAEGKKRGCCRVIGFNQHADSWKN